MRLAKGSAALATTAALLLAPAGCGGGGGESTGSLTKAQFLKKANAICAGKTAAMGKGDAAFWKRHGGLGLPRGDERWVEKILTAWEEGVEKAEEDPARCAHAMGIDYGLEKCWLG